VVLDIPLSPRTGKLLGRLFPFLALLLLYFPLSYVDVLCHEMGHCLLALAQGGTCTGIVIRQEGGEALANSYLVSFGGWLAQYVLALAVVLLSRALEPKSFTARSVVVLIVLFNLMGPPTYIASLHDDSFGALQVLEATGVGLNVSIVLLEGAAAVLFVVGGYVSWKALSAYLSDIFGWMESKRSSQAALVLIAVGVPIVLISSAILNGPEPQFSFEGSATFIALIFSFALVIIPPAPPSWRGTNVGPSRAALAVIVLLFIETQLIYFFVVPITIPIPP